MTSRADEKFVFARCPANDFCVNGPYRHLLYPNDREWKNCIPNSQLNYSFYIFKTLVRAIPFPSTPFQRSPTLFSMASMLNMWKSCGLRSWFTSSHFSGVETVACGFGLRLYGAAMVCSFQFWRKSI